MKAFVKDPDATLDYAFDWSQWLSNDTIVSSEWVAESGITKVPASESIDGNITRVFISGGAVGESYTLANKITTNASRIDERSIEIKIRQR